MNNEEIIDYILFERLAPIIDSFNCFNFEDGDASVIRKLRELYTVWIDETKERILCEDYLSDNPDNFIYKCETMLISLIGITIMDGYVNKFSFEGLLTQMRIYMLKDKNNPFFKLKKIAKKKQDIEQDFK